MKDLTAAALVAACSDDSGDAGITIRTVLEPIAGPGAPVKPAVYAGGLFQSGKRWWGDGPDRRVVEIIVIDNEPSQANRLEAALDEFREQLGLPAIILDLSSAGELPAHLPRQISSFKFPHRNADAYLRDSMLDGQKFMDTDIGRAVFASTADNPDALLEWCPQALLFGFWQSHLGKKRSQAKLARAWVSEIVGIEPAATDVRRLGLKGDPLNLSTTEPVAIDDTTHEWDFSEKGKKLADVGHGQVPVSGDDAPLGAVSFREVVQQSTVSFASLRRVRASVGSAEARALIASIGIAAHAVAFGRPFSLRSGADLRPVSATWRWLGGDGDEELVPPTAAAAGDLLRTCAAMAEARGLPVGKRWPSEPLSIVPAPNLLGAIQRTWPVE